MRNRYDQQLHLLKKEMISIGALCETAIARSAQALLTGDCAQAGHGAFRGNFRQGAGN